MTLNGRFMVCCFGLAIWFVSIAVAFAHEPEARPQSASSGGQGFAEVSGNIAWDTIEWIERRYKIEAMGFKARDESGIDFLGADEVMIRTEDAKGWTVSDKINDVDSGETYTFDFAKSCIIALRPGIVVLGKTSVCDNVGEPAPFWFGVEFWEKDVFGFPGFCVLGTPGPGFHAGPHCVDGDNFIGRAQIDLTQQDLDAVLLNVGEEYIETVVLDPCPGPDICNNGSGPWDHGDYTFTYRITRLPDVRVKLSAELGEAMRKIGARSELEAIAAGLRALRTPKPRQVDPDTARPEAAQ